DAHALALADVPEPVPGSGQVRVRVAGCGVCHTDIGFWRDGVPTRHPLPLTLGHEVSGVVTAADNGFGHLVGREVIVPAVIPCGECALCRTGRGNACRAQMMPGNDLDGGFAESIVVPGRGLCVVEDRGTYDLDELAVVADAVTTPYQAVMRSGLASGGLAVVVGVGGVGGYAVQIAAALGARVVAVDVSAGRLAAIASHGAELTLDASALDFKTIKQQIAASARAWGCASYGWTIFECSGTTAGQETAYGLLGTAGTLMVVGFTLGKVALRLSNLMAFDATVQGTWGCCTELYPEALRLVTSGRITLKPFIERHPLEDGAEVLRRAADHELHRRAILVPDGHA
ncbi:MAG TPA: 6-hydroxycyclohex-1-ene-1-carbonyl-CoA dehydrogenase, partial [Candidatus Eisenbacteria bacterium]